MSCPTSVNDFSGSASTAVQAGWLTGTPTAPNGYANSGVHIGDVHLGRTTPARSRYHHQVRRIAPAHLVGRQSELAELATFCTAPGSGYALWRAKPGAGKSALMAWFALHPPPDVRVVSFFVTTRWAEQADREAFLDNALDQLIALTGQEPPRLLTGATKEAHLLGLLDDAAADCRERGEHLVLLVDGLDADRGARRGHSIAAVLPHPLPTSGIRVVVTARTGSPLPVDVPCDHPLRDPGQVRELRESPLPAVRTRGSRYLKQGGRVIRTGHVLHRTRCSVRRPWDHVVLAAVFYLRLIIRMGASHRACLTAPARPTLYRALAPPPAPGPAGPASTGRGPRASSPPTPRSPAAPRASRSSSRPPPRGASAPPDSSFG